MSLGITIGGTIALELAFMRTPFICTGNPPFARLFPKRIVSSQVDYFERSRRYWLEPEITIQESDAAAYYVAEFEYLLKTPQINLSHGSTFITSPREMYEEAVEWR